MAARLSTGLAGLDAQLGGGFPPGTCHLLLGEPMNASDLFGFHFAAGGTRPGQQKGEGTLYVTTSRKPQAVLDGIKLVGGDVDEVQASKIGKDGPPDVGRGRYVLDSFSEYVQEQTWDKAYKRLRQLGDQAREGDSVLLATAVPDLHTPREVATLKLWADGVLELGFDRQGFGLYPYLKVTKMRGVPDSARFLLFKETDRGLFMESTRRVF